MLMKRTKISMNEQGKKELWKEEIKPPPEGFLF